MSEDMAALHRAVEQIEDHAATIGVLLDTLRAGHRNARSNPALRRRLEREIAYYVGRLGQLHAERDTLRRQIMERRNQE